MNALPVLSVSALPALSVSVPPRSQTLPWFPAWSASLRWSSASVWWSSAPPWWSSTPVWWFPAPPAPPWWAPAPSAPPWWAPVPSSLPWLPALPQSPVSPFAHGPGPPSLPLFHLRSTSLLDHIGASGSRSLGGGALSRIRSVAFRPIATRGHSSAKNMLSVCASSAGAIADRSKTFKTVKLLQSKENYFLLSFPSVNFGSCHNKPKLSSFLLFC